MKDSRIWNHVAGVLAVCLPIAAPASGCGQPPDDSSATSKAAVPAGDAAVANADGLIASPEPGWPQWRGPRRDGISAETGLLPSWPEGGPRLLWKTDRLGAGWSSPIVVEGRLYITGDVDDDLVIFAFDLEGNLQWQAPRVCDDDTHLPCNKLRGEIVRMAAQAAGQAPPREHLLQQWTQVRHKTIVAGHELVELTSS